MAESLAVRRSSIPTSLSRVHEVLDAFAERDYNGELLTALRHFSSARGPVGGLPRLGASRLAAAYAAKGIRRPYTHQAEAAEAVHAGKNKVVAALHSLAKNG